MMVKETTVLSDENVRIPNAADARVSTFVDTKRNNDLVFLGGLRYAPDLGARHLHGVCGEPAEEVVVRDGGAYRTPKRKCGNKGLGKCDQPCSLACRLCDQ